MELPLCPMPGITLYNYAFKKIRFVAPGPMSHARKFVRNYDFQNNRTLQYIKWSLVIGLFVVTRERVWLRLTNHNALLISRGNMAVQDVD